MLFRKLKLKVKEEKGSVDIITFAICFVVLLSLVVASLEYFIPINKYFALKEVSRKTLFKMEQSGGLSLVDKNALITTLTGMGLTNVTVAGTATAKLSQEINLRVEADFTYSKLTLFLRSNKTEHFVYDRTMVQRKVTN